MIEKIRAHLGKKEYSAVKELLAELNPADIAALLERFSKEESLLLFRLLSKETAAETFVFFDGDTQENFIRSFSDTELKEVLDELYLDDTVDIIEEMPANVVTRILRNADSQLRKDINQILKYPKDSAGSIMTIEFVSLKPDMTVADAFKRIKRTGIDKETVYTCYVTDENKKLIGVTTVRQMLMQEMEDIIGDIMESNVISVTTMEDQEAVAHLFNKYDFLALPVVDTENRLVGIITVDDALDVIQEENTEDIEKMAAITPTDKPYLKTTVFEAWRKRIPWLMLLMVSATFTGQIIQYYEDALGAYVILTAFIPMLMDTGGNAGGQTSVTVIRGLSLNEIRMKDIFRILGKEVCVAILCGISLAVVNFGKMLVVDRTTALVAAVVSLTLMCTVLIAKAVGSVLPIIAKKLGFDPAVMASPFITTIVDALSLLVYFNIASLILNI